MRSKHYFYIEKNKDNKKVIMYDGTACVFTSNSYDFPKDVTTAVVKLMNDNLHGKVLDNAFPAQPGIYATNNSTPQESY